MQETCERRAFPFCFIGGLALQRYGEARVTRDVDLSVLTGFGGEEHFALAFLEEFSPRMPNALDFAMQHRVLLLLCDGIGIDISFAGLPFEEEMIRRSSLFEMLPQLPLRTCSAEDLVILKCFASRPQDWIDVENILTRQSSLDWAYIEPRLSELAEMKNEPEIMRRLELLKKQAVERK